MAVDIATLAKPLSNQDKTCYLHPDEHDFYEAYSAHLKAADALATSNLYVDAIYHLNFSVECFFKYVFCLVRNKELNVQTIPDADNWLNKWLSGYPFNKKRFHAISFSHDLGKLRIFLEMNSNVKGSIEFNDLVSYLPPNEFWVYDRYKPRKDLLFQNKFTDYRSALDTALNTLFQGIK